ncbi:MAG: serine--tRNA ligase [Alphaproteobacteria bacterium]|nr:serine--tRNA ligase [Alphaproteobacteria bacterium]MBU0797106.1 serine--tRNA ligase [Alphaproteobacteria bacterium]MBU0887913.1 serine--tRNA ligase [Alphaproteobacteria bacterium]MBU1814864.1 serine--tRNA ligase [Alphaproteobacteria bacterium]
MIDLKLIRDDAAAFDAALVRRALPPMAADILDKDARRRAAQTELQSLQARRNEASKEIGQIKRQGGDAEALMDEVAGIKDRMAALEIEDKALGEELDAILAGIPNLPAADVPEGTDEADNVEIRRKGNPRNFSFTPKEHFEIGEALGMMDFEAASKLSGARFVVLRKHLARLERALAAFMLDIHTLEFGYEETQVPFMVRDHVLYGTGQLPKFGEDLFRTTNDYWLIPTAEVPLTNLVADTILDEKELPKRFTAYSPCFRSEAGAAGRDTRGMIRQHQFTKVEMVSIAHPDESEAEHQRMTCAAETVLERLDLPYRTIILCTGDMGFGAQKTYDIEVWLPGQGAYREISSCSNCGDFQARRMKARFRAAGEKNTRFVHTLNGSGLAVGRTMVAILENYQNEDGSVTIPEKLRPYMAGLEVIRADA